MAEEEDDASKTEDPTGKKLSDAREKGNVPMSQEAKNWLMLLGGLVVVCGGTGGRVSHEGLPGGDVGVIEE